MSTTPANGERLEAPSAVMAWDNDNVFSGLLLLKASSIAGRLVNICARLSSNSQGVLRATYILLVNGHRPPCSNACVSILAESHPERTSTLLPFGPVPWWRQALLHIQTDAVLPM